MTGRKPSAHVSLEDFLNELQPGDRINVAAAAEATGLAFATCELVFSGLARVHLFRRTSASVFVRRRLPNAPQQLEHGKARPWSGPVLAR